jgi:hypothetical protein
MELFQLAGDFVSIILLVANPVFTNEALALINMSPTFPVTGLTIFLK